MLTTREACFKLLFNFLPILSLSLLPLLSSAQSVYGNRLGTMCGIFSSALSQNVTCDYLNHCPPNYEMVKMSHILYSCFNNNTENNPSLFKQGTLCGLYPGVPCDHSLDCAGWFAPFADLGFSTCYATGNNIQNLQVTVGMLCGVGNAFPCSTSFPGNGCPSGFKSVRGDFTYCYWNIKY